MNQKLISQLETLLFIAQKPLSARKVAELTAASPEDVREALGNIAERFRAPQSGIVLFAHNDHYEFATNPSNAEYVQAYAKEEVDGELTRAGLETLAILAYRGPLAKSALENIRGVNCAVILRNLMIRGFIDRTGEQKGEYTYAISLDFLRHLGIASASDLPDYERMRNDHTIAGVLNNTEQL